MSIVAHQAPDVLFVIGGLDVGGTERHLATVAPDLVQRGWKVAVYSLAGSGALRGELERGHVTVIVPPFERDKGSRSLVSRSFRLAVATAHLLSVMIRRKPRIVHFFLPAAYLVGAPLAIITRVPIRVMSRRSLNIYQRGYPFVRSVESFLHRKMAAILGNSRSVLRQLREEESAPADRLALIYNGIETAAFAKAPTRQAIRAELALGASTFVMVIVANLIPYKGHGDLLQALAIAGAGLPDDCCLLIVGRDDGIGNRLRATATALSIDAKVRFLGPRNDVAAILNASDVGILCSHEEGFSNAVLEGMAAGLPMIVTDVGGNPEAVADGESGLVVPPKDPPRLAQAILRLANDSDLRARLGKAAKQRVADHFTLDRCVANYDALYRALLETGKPAPQSS
jgi:glycosyltransferase involved in cell wall biosynthesis